MTVRILTGDCREVLRTLPDDSVHCVVTSPPYFGLRDYGTAQWEGGDPACDHSSDKVSRDCRRCWAIRIDNQIGLEPTPDAYVAEMVAVFREVRRVLRGDGIAWINLGDSYCSIGHKKSNSGHGTTGLAGGKAQEHHPLRRENNVPGLKHKDLIGIPWRVAFALQADGWYLRQDIIWSKPNPMPESVRDRCTKAHEYIFLLSKSQRYHYDQDAIAEACDPSNIEHGKKYGSIAAITPKGNPNRNDDGGSANQAGIAPGRETRNRRSVWNVNPQPFPDAHFATFPPALIEPCIKAGCPKEGMVLDPFGGAGTTGLVADRLGRNAILVELNPEYAAMAERRIHNDAPLFAEVSA